MYIVYIPIHMHNVYTRIYVGIYIGDTAVPSVRSARSSIKIYILYIYIAIIAIYIFIFDIIMITISFQFSK